MKINDWIDGLIEDQSLTHKERLFIPLVIISCLGIFAYNMVELIMGEGKEKLVASFVGSILMFVVSYISYRNKKMYIGANIIAGMMIYILFPLFFLTGGGMYGATPMWFIYGVVFVCLTVQGKLMYVYLVSCLFISVICYYIGYRYPDLVMQQNKTVMYVDSLMCLIIVSCVNYFMILVKGRIVFWESEYARKQKEQVEALKASQNNFFSTMSHEIRTPINSIIGLNELIIRDPHSEDVAENARNIQNASKMLLTLINDILDMSKMESGKMEIVPVSYNVGDMLSDIVNMVWVRAKDKGLEFSVDVDKNMPTSLLGDEVRIKQVLINVLNNAVKYTEKGSVTLSIQCEKVENRIAHVVYSVSDTGMGIKKENIPYLFTAFKRVDEEKNRYIEGTGLGLTIVKQLLLLMGGDITVNSVYTQGSDFVITLPQRVMDEEKMGELNIAERHALNAKKHYKQSFEAPEARVLIVDDNEANLMVAAKLLKDTKVQIDCVSSGEECLQMTLKTAYHMIFMDHLMPKMDGIECLRAMRSQPGGLNCETPVVVFTANAGSDKQALYRREGFDGYLLKPVTGNQLEMELLKNLPRELLTITSNQDIENQFETINNKHVKKVSIMITTDSVCDIPKNILEKYKIEVMPYILFTEAGEFLDGVEADTEGIVSYMEGDKKEICSKVQGVEEYERFFAKQLMKAYHVIHISLPMQLSNGGANAKEASEVFDSVDVVDSENISAGMGLLVLRAAEYAAQGRSVDDILQQLEIDKKKIKTSFVVDKTKYLRRSNYISARIDTLCSTLMLHPIFEMRRGKLQISDLITGQNESAWKNYIIHSFAKTSKINKQTLFIVYVSLTPKELEQIEELVKQRVEFKRIVFSKASSAISVNYGPRTFGLSYEELGNP